MMRTVHSALLLNVCIGEIPFNEDNLKGDENVSGLGDLGTTVDLPGPWLSYNFKEQLSSLLYQCLQL